MVLSSTLNAGLGAGAPKVAVSVGARSTSTPASANTVRASSNHVQCPLLVRWYVPNRPLTASRRSAGARSKVNVGEPVWSSTTRRESRSEASRSMVFTKLPPVVPSTQEVRTM
jgi:hypothetical protein